MPGLQVNRADSSHIEEIVELFRKWSPDHPELASKNLLEWQKCNRYVTTLSGKIVGHIAQIPQTLHLNDAPIKMGWAATLVLDESNPLRQAMAGTMLLDNLINDNSLGFGAVGLVPEIENSYVRRGFSIDRQSICMYGRFFKTRPVLEYFGKSSLLGPGIHLGNLAFPCRRGEKNVIEANQFESDWDGVWQNTLSSQYQAFCERTAEYLNHQIRQPNKQYTILLHMKDEEQPSGYAVCRAAQHPSQSLKLYKICDLVGDSAARLALLSEAVKRARQVSVDGIVALSSQLDASLYRKAGLWVRKPLPVVMRPERACAIHLTFFDSDLDHLW